MLKANPTHCITQRKKWRDQDEHTRDRSGSLAKICTRRNWESIGKGMLETDRYVHGKGKQKERRKKKKKFAPTDRAVNKQYGVLKYVLY